MCIVCEMRKEQKERVDAIKVNLAFTQSQTDNTNAITIATLATTMTDLQNIGQRERAEAVGKLIDGLLPKVVKPQKEPELKFTPGVKKAPVAPTKQEEIANLAESLAEQLGCTVEVFTFPQK